MRWPSKSSAYRPGLAVGALCVSASAVMLKLADTTPGTATVARCAFALPVVGALAVREHRRGALPRSAVLSGAICGVFFAGDMMLWTQAIPEVGAGLSTVLVNAQVALVPMLAWLVDREPVTGRFLVALPILLAGVVLAGGVFEHGIAGSDPARGTLHAVGAALCYSGFLFLLRRGGQSGHPMQTYLVVLTTAAAAALAMGFWWHGMDLRPGWPTLGWLILVTISGQLLGWLLVAFCSARLPSSVSSALLLLTPVGAIVFGAAALHERPTTLQLTGCVLVLLAGYAAAVRPAAVRPVRCIARRALRTRAGGRARHHCPRH